MSSVLTGIVSTAYKLAFEISPIFLTGGIATSLINSATQAAGLNVSVGTGALPIVALTQATSFGIGILTGNPPTDLGAFFAHFVPLPGSTLIDYDVSTYPFANQTVAANAMIAKGLNISLEMICPATGELGFASKLATMELLTSTVNKHIQLGGTFTVLTGAQLYTNCLLKRIVDISAGDTAQRQWRYQWDFFQPLITLAAAQTSQNNLLSKISAGVPTDGSLSGANSIINQPPAGAATQNDFTSAGAVG
jgi:hypothetical protein